MTGNGPQPARPPAATRIVGVVLAVAGVMYVIVGFSLVSTDDQAGALVAMGGMVLGAVCLVFGWNLVQGRRWAYLGAATVLALAVIAGVIAAISSAERTVLAQLFVPAIGLYLLSRREARDYFMV